MAQVKVPMLVRPVPLMQELRERKKGYNNLPIDMAHPLFDEPLVDVAAYGIAGQAHYSRPNGTTVDPVDGVPTTQWLRQSVAETLAQINEALQSPEITEFFGGEVELYVEDALRPLSLQQHLHDEIIPALIKKNHPGYSDKEVAERVKDIIARPSVDPQKPSPHATGGVFDIVLRFKQKDRGYVEDATVEMGHVSGGTSEQINPDFFEYTMPDNEKNRLGQRNRRAYYAIMTGQAFGFGTGFVNNPTEWWHWGRGDQLSAKVSGEVAYYSLAEPDRA